MPLPVSPPDDDLLDSAWHLAEAYVKRQNGLRKWVNERDPLAYAKLNENLEKAEHDYRAACHRPESVKS